MATATSGASGLRARPATYAGLFVITLTTLMYEIVLTRIFSVTMWYHFAFVAISVALFGTTVGALIVHLRPDSFTEDKVERQMWRYSLGFGAAVALAFLTQLAIPFVPHMTAAGVMSIVLTCVVISVPFICSGVVVALALTRFQRVNRLYAADLVGAGLGCVALVVVFRWLDGPSLVIAIAAAACFGSLLLAFPAGVNSAKAASTALLLVLVATTVFNVYKHDQGNPFIRVLWAKEQQDTLHTMDRWNAFSRITVDGRPTDVGWPAGYGMSKELPGDIVVPQMSILIDGTAGTMITGYPEADDPEAESRTDFLRYDVTNLGYYGLEDGANTAVIGVGGGRDVLSGLEFGADKVTGIEINNNILDIVTNKLGDFTHLKDNPRVRLVNDEARSWLTRSDDRFDMIQMSLIDTWAASSAGAYALSENSLYTTDAWNTFFDRIDDDGMLSVSRWFSLVGRPPYETLRTAALASEVLTQRGVENPRDNVLIFEGPPTQFGATAATILVSEKPLTDERIETITDKASELGFNTILTPDAVSGEYPEFADLVAPGGPSKGLEQFDIDLSPPTDNRPFFFQMAKVGTFLKGEGFSDDLVFRPVLTLGSLALAVLLLAAVCIGLPLVKMGRRSKHAGMAPYYAFFAGIGLGFMLVEFSQLQRLATFLGHPTYALAVVLFTVLVFSGLGSMAVEKVIDPQRPRSLLMPVGVLLVLLVVFGVFTHTVIDAAEASTTPIRIAVAVAILAPLALFMGMPFSLGMAAAGRNVEAPTAFMWGINGAMSVVASVFAVLIAMFFGINAAFGAGTVAYLVAGAAMFVIVRRLAALGGGEPAVAGGADDSAGDPAGDDDGEPVLVVAGATAAGPPSEGAGNGNGARPAATPAGSGKDAGD
jgi:hypothetical protein